MLGIENILLDQQTEQVLIESPDITATIIWFPGWLVLVATVYVLGENTQTLRDTCAHLSKVIADTRREASTVVEMVIDGDFNRYDRLWGGDEVSMERQGEADPIIDMMNELALSSFLRQARKHGTAGITTRLLTQSQPLRDLRIKTIESLSKSGFASYCIRDE